MVQYSAQNKFLKFHFAATNSTSWFTVSFQIVSHNLFQGSHFLNQLIVNFC